MARPIFSSISSPLNDSQGHGGGIRPRLHTGKGNVTQRFMELQILPPLEVEFDLFSNAKLNLNFCFFNEYCEVYCDPLIGNDSVNTFIAGANVRNNRTSVAKQRISKHVFLTIYAVFCMVRARKCSATIVESEESSFGTSACQDMSLVAEELN
jgi:hypothetical protein